ncbi:hypothetical protein LWI29_035455 [Acer saccharum]|uniref:SWIM-type domain-containing protein n=1 Tax=Acer saccharum TaxID=4024 RepID=A0AA39REZ0_ACESA|nr:hypothetical protein LWI29_035455 [Acer saccharum]
MLLCDDGHVPEVYVSVVEKVSVEPGHVAVCTDQPIYQSFRQQLAAQFQSAGGSNNVVGSIPTTNHAVETPSVNPIIYEDPTINEVMLGRCNEDERSIPDYNPHTDYGLDDFDEDYNGHSGSREGVNNDPAHYDGMESDPSEGGRSGSMPPDGEKDGLVNLSEKTCTCREFQNDLLPCCHALAAIRFCKKKFGDFCSDFYKTSTWLESYSGVIFPVGHPSEWNTPEEVRSEVVLPPEWRPQAGRPRKKRVPSAGEHGPTTRYCTICKKSGHNRQNCPNPPADQQPNVVDPQPDPQPNVADQQPDPQPRRRRKCQSCGQEGHNIRTCPTRPYDNLMDPNIDVE